MGCSCCRSDLRAGDDELEGSLVPAVLEMVDVIVGPVVDGKQVSSATIIASSSRYFITLQSKVSVVFLRYESNL